MRAALDCQLASLLAMTVDSKVDQIATKERLNSAILHFRYQSLI